MPTSSPPPAAAAGADAADERFLAGLAARVPDDPEIFRRLAQARLRLGQLEEARNAAERALQLAPDAAAGHFALGQVRRGLRDFEQARRSLETAVSLDPKMGLAWMGLGEVLATLPGGTDKAVEALRRAVSLLPRDPRPLNGLATVLMAAGRYEDAITAYRSAVALVGDPNPADLLNNLGVALERLERRDEAVAVLRTAVLVRPNVAAIHDNLGNSLLSTGNAAAAEACHRRALALGGKGAETWSNLGNALHRQGRLDEAEAAYRRAIQASPNAAKFHTNLALNLLLSGKFAEGWREYEWRWREHPNLPPYLRDRVWDGSPLPPDLPAGGTLLLQAEQGYGDTIQFVRYAGLLKRRGVSRVVLACQPELVRLVSSVAGLDQVVPETDRLPAFDRAITLMSLAGMFRAGDEPVPAETPYLKVPAGAGVTLPAGEGGARVGIAWAGRPTHGDDWNRSIPARLLEPLLEVPGVTFHSLQRGAIAERIGRPPPGRVMDTGDRCADFADTAAAVDAMDLIISVDTAVVHLAAALGKPVWVLLPPVPDFRWLMQGETSAWYPTLRLLRRRFDGGWEPVVAQAAAMLRDFVGRRRSG
ncbi:tetratricopeptide repeat protein [Magnetospirillum sp. SS-4]|uniref:tetratricopeptide repeat protein n=1 Tax=Magnetospirillum sp. SS-4 TaxID=2681465 RepID=UPI00137F6510|nr:tetratricopeptide repeat protein [Magnetospirillum sp. SS-4]CAA7617985.1 TPR repeat-containing protein [Magnetospirillum sp. SS-4]